MAYQWPIDKLSLLNRALVVTRNNPVSVLEDGSIEYNVCSAAYEDGLAVLMEEANWGWSTKVATLQPSPTAPADTDWDTAYPLPNDLVHIIWVKINDVSASAGSSLMNRAVLYDILENQLVVNAQGGPPPPSPAITPSAITMKYAANVDAELESSTPLFVRSLTYYVMSGLYRWMGNSGEADKMFQAADAIAQRARSRYDMQKPKRSLWRSQISAVRRARLPWYNRDGNYPRC